MQRSNAPLNIYVAGIDLKKIESDIQSKTECIINLINQIKRDAVAALGDDVTVIALLHEGVLTRRAISSIDKKSCLKKLEGAIKKFDRVLLIPGSFISYKTLSESSDPSKKKNMILENYNKHLSYTLYNDVFQKNHNIAKERLNSENANDSIILQNVSYAISSDINAISLKFKKSLPWWEEDQLDDKSNYVFAVGGENVTQNVCINGEELDIRILICADYFINGYECVEKIPSALEVVVSDSIEMDKAYLVGAVNIQMDSDTGLKVVVNDRHPKAHLFGEIKSFCYYPDASVALSQQSHCEKKESTISFRARSFEAPRLTF